MGGQIQAQLRSAASQSHDNLTNRRVAMPRGSGARFEVKRAFSRDRFHRLHWDGPQGIGCEVVFAILHPMSGFVQLLKVNIQNRHEMEHQNSACAQQFQRTKKLSSDAAIRKQRAFDRKVQPWAKFMRVGSGPAKSRFEKHLHACIVASHVVNRARDAC